MSEAREMSLAAYQHGLDAGRKAGQDRITELEAENKRLKALEHYISNTYWHNPEDAIGDIRVMLRTGQTTTRCEHGNKLSDGCSDCPF